LISLLLKMPHTSANKGRKHSFFSSLFGFLQPRCTVKRVDEVVRHPHLVTQDQFTQVSKKVSDIPEENFTINIELFRQSFSNVGLLRQKWMVWKVTSPGARTYVVRFTFQYSTTAPHLLPYLRVQIQNCPSLHLGQFRDQKSLDLHEKSLDLSNFEIFPHKILKSRTFKKSSILIVKRRSVRQWGGGGVCVCASLLSNFFNIFSQFFIVEKVGLTSVLV
jgi:hypothetical protein